MTRPDKIVQADRDPCDRGPRHFYSPCGRGRHGCGRVRKCSTEFDEIIGIPCGLALGQEINTPNAGLISARNNLWRRRYPPRGWSASL